MRRLSVTAIAVRAADPVPTRILRISVPRLEIGKHGRTIRRMRQLHVMPIHARVVDPVPTRILRISHPRPNDPARPLGDQNQTHNGVGASGPRSLMTKSPLLHPGPSISSSSASARANSPVPACPRTFGVALPSLHDTLPQCAYRPAREDYWRCRSSRHRSNTKKLPGALAGT
jgi:hypothetical protein